MDPIIRLGLDIPPYEGAVMYIRASQIIGVQLIHDKCIIMLKSGATERIKMSSSGKAIEALEKNAAGE